MIKIFLVGMIMVMFMVSGAQALDESACDNFPHNWGSNVSCLGLLDIEDMGAFDGPDGSWQWKTEFVDLFQSNNWSPINIIDRLDEPKPIGESTLGNSTRLDNKRYPASMNIEPNSRIHWKGLKGGHAIPKIWKMYVTDPTVSNDTWYGHENQIYPVDILHTDLQYYPYCWEQFNNGDTSCDNDNDGDGIADGSPGAVWRWVNTSPILLSDVSHLEWVDSVDGFVVYETVTPWYTEFDRFIYMNYNTGINSLQPYNVTEDNVISFNHFQNQFPVGIHAFRVVLNSGSSLGFTVEVRSNQIMPTVSSFSDGLTFQKVKFKVKKGEEIIKIIDKEKDITVVNMTAREITANDDSTRLLIQWKAPDEAMTLTGNVRLRIFVGNSWFDTNLPQGADRPMSFLWIDAPLHTGSVVVPEQQYQWIKDEMTNKGLTNFEVGGMYREQFNQNENGFAYHNRGYFEGIVVEF